MTRGAARRQRAHPAVWAVPVLVLATACGSQTAYEDPSSAGGTAAATTSSPTATTRTAESADVMLLRPTEVPAVTGDQVGSGDLVVGVAGLDGGQVGITQDGPRGGEAFAFPAYVEAGRYPRAALTVSNASDDEDELDPGEDDFSWGASFRLDRASEGRSDDNGNNLVQRGLFSQPTFYKAELDEDKAGCSIRGTKGVVILHSPYVVPVGVWHKLQCDRFGRYVRLQIWNLETGELVSTGAKDGAIGTLSTPSGHAQVPLSVGGKVKPDGGLVRLASDQFNGQIANPFLRIDD